MSVHCYTCLTDTNSSVQYSYKFYRIYENENVITHISTYLYWITFFSILTCYSSNFNQLKLYWCSCWCNVMHSFLLWWRTIPHSPDYIRYHYHDHIISEVIFTVHHRLLLWWYFHDSQFFFFSILWDYIQSFPHHIAAHLANKFLSKAVTACFLLLSM